MPEQIESGIAKRIMITMLSQKLQRRFGGSDADSSTVRVELWTLSG